MIWSIIITSGLELPTCKLTQAYSQHLVLNPIEKLDLRNEEMEFVGPVQILGKETAVAASWRGRIITFGR